MLSPILPMTLLLPCHSWKEIRSTCASSQDPAVLSFWYLVLPSYTCLSHRLSRAPGIPTVLIFVQRLPGRQRMVARPSTIGSWGGLGGFVTAILVSLAPAAKCVAPMRSAASAAGRGGGGGIGRRSASSTTSNSFGGKSVALSKAARRPPQKHVAPVGPGKRVQIHRALAKFGEGSRGQNWAKVKEGRVTVNGRWGLPTSPPCPVMLFEKITHLILTTTGVIHVVQDSERSAVVGEHGGRQDRGRRARLQHGTLIAGLDDEQTQGTADLEGR